MAKLTPEDLDRIAERMKRQTTLREGAGRAKVTVHMGTCGIAAGARKIMTALLAVIEKEGTDDVILTTSGCAGLCSREPMMTVELKDNAPVKYVDLDEDKTRQIFTDHVLGGKIVSDFALAVGSERQS
ncbi:MAG TPA: (2Fe-2S) ferredoxin domain-containing protein [Phycisphaerae bacterium]|nr:(2Fe-2S) ferredoxin domain-containing protein [Phycisphaerae bacterium]HDZ43886.1 (2Fe-2S) ferredoxin domain-containing protein [Phycisphaerae bacterium]